jgi:hypothetical protein
MSRIIAAALAGGTLALVGLTLAQAAPERVVVTHEAVAPVPRLAVLPIAADSNGWTHAIHGGAGGGGVGGAIGGYYINGTTPSDNRPLSDGLPPRR